MTHFDMKDEGPASEDQAAGSTNAEGWDGKLRVDRRAVLVNPEALSDPDYSDEDAPPVQQLAADEGSVFLKADIPSLTVCHGRSLG